MQLNSFYVIGQNIKEDEIQYLFYSNEFERLNSIHFYNDSLAVGVRDGNILALIKAGLIVDEINIRDYTKSDWESIEKFLPLESGEILIMTKQNQMILHAHDTVLKIDYIKNKGTIKIDHFNLSKLKPERIIEEANKYCLMGQFKDFIFGQYFINDKLGKSKKHEKPSFWLSNEDGLVAIETEGIKISDDLFYDNWSIWGCRYDRDFFILDGKIYFFIPDTFQVYITDIESKTTQHFDFNKFENASSFYMFYDHLDRRIYSAVKYGSVYEIYQFNRNDNKLQFLTTIDYVPHAIINSKIHRVDVYKSKRKKYTNHYLMPIYDSDKIEKTVIINEIEISN